MGRWFTWLQAESCLQRDSQALGEGTPTLLKYLFFQLEFFN